MNIRCNSRPLWGTAKIIFALPAALTAALMLAAAQPVAAQPGWVLSHQKISDTQGGFTGILDDFDIFGVSVASLGDLDGDGVGDLAVGARNDDDGARDRGAVWVLFLNNDGTVKSHQKISDTEGGFTDILDDSDTFASSVASLGDLDGDGVGDLGVGAGTDDDGGASRGAMWVLFLDGGSCDPCDANCDGSVDLADVEPFIELLLGGKPCDACTGDTNGDGSVDLTDVEGFIECLLG